VAGDASSFTVTTMHDLANTFDPLFAHQVQPGRVDLSFEDETRGLVQRQAHSLSDYRRHFFA
jgi:hypothetical protein